MTSTLLTPPHETMATALVREFFDNGLDVYDARKQRLGTVLDFDRPGGGFVVRVTHSQVCLFLPMQLVAKIKRGRVYLSKCSETLTRKRC